MEDRLSYLSWSKMNLVLKSSQLFIERYLECRDQFVNDYMALGKMFAERIKSGKKTDNKVLEHLVLFLPKSTHYEYEINADYEGIPIKCFLDGFSPRKKEIRELKTGKKWTQALANGHGQLKFYSTAIFIKFGYIPKVFLDWLLTEETEDGILKPTGVIKTFEVKITMADIITFRAEMKKAWREIQRLIKEYYKDFTI